MGGDGRWTGWPGWKLHECSVLACGRCQALQGWGGAGLGPELDLAWQVFGCAELRKKGIEGRGAV